MTRAEAFLSLLESRGVLVDLHHSGGLTFCGPDMRTIGRARELITAEGLEGELVLLLLARRGDKPPLDRLVDELAAGPVHWGRLVPRFGESTIREAKARRLIVEQADGFLRLPREGEGRAPVRAAARPRLVRTAGGAEELLGRLARGPLSWNEVRPFGPDVVADLIRAGRIEASLDGRFYLAGQGPREDAA